MDSPEVPWDPLNGSTAPAVLLLPKNHRSLPVEMYGSIIKSIQCKAVNIHEELKASRRPFFALLDGMAGTGKSTQALKIAKDVAAQVFLTVFPLVIFLDLQSHELLNVQSIYEILDGYFEISQACREHVCRLLFEKANTIHVLFVIDSWDEFVAKNESWKKSFIAKIVKREVFPESSVFLASRLPGLYSVYKLTSPTIHLQITGLEPSSVHQFMLQKSREMGTAESDIDRLTEYLKYHDVYHMCCVPGLAMNILQFYETKKYLLPETVTALLYSVVLKVMQQELVRSGQMDAVCELSHINDLPRDVRHRFDSGCKLSLAHLLNNDLNIDARSVSYLLLSEGSTGLQDVAGLGLVEPATFPRRHQRPKDQPLYTFLHPTICEFMAAHCITQAPVVSQQKLFVDQLERVRKSQNFCKFYFGLACLNKESWFSPAKLGLPCVVEGLLHGLTCDKELSMQDLFFILHCLHETQEPSVVRKLTSKHEKLLSIQLGDKELTEHECSTLSFFISSSEIQKWSCQFITDKQLHGAEFLRFLSTGSSRTPVDITLEKGTRFYIKADVSSSKSSKRSTVFTPHSLYCRSIKDTLHPVFQMYSPVRVRSDCSDPGYTSYISCRCLEEALQSSIVIEPIQTIHCIDLPPRNKSRTEADNRHLEEAHGMKRMEVIQLSTPYLSSVKFILPGTREEMSVRLSAECEPSPMESRIVKEVEGYIFSDEKLVPCYQQEDRSKPTVVVPALPLPRKQHGMSTQKESQIQTAEQEKQAAPADNQRQTLAVTAEHLGITSQALANGSFAFQATAVAASEQGAQQSSSKKQAAKPGTILYSQMPHVMAYDKIYALPDESQCIRRGGNGEIFIGTYAGITFAIKKTIYRSREFAILSKMQHKNIIPLLILMVGEQHPQHRRRYFCYHFMPKMTGDCARMLTDHHNLTLKELQHSYSDNPRDMGMVLGNLRYLLAEILRGLHYLHSCHIVHRDVKASNILIKMHCMHDNPLTCSCANKCSVVVSDFDAAVELDSSDHLQPIQPSSSQRQEQLLQRDVFLVVPVGTLGFRAPECSMLSVSNSIGVIDPPLTTKADIWSFGMFLLRLLIGSEGPCSQREIAMLLLHYNHQRKQSRNVRYPSPPQPIISDSRLQKLLKFSTLKEELKGVSSPAIDVVKQCLQVDPVIRASAQTLLQHPFLRVHTASSSLQH